MNDTLVSLNELIDVLCDVNIEQKVSMDTNIPTFWKQFFNVNYSLQLTCYNNVDDCLSNIYCNLNYEHFKFLNESEQKTYMQTQTTNLKQYNIILLKTNCANYTHFNKKNKKNIIIVNVDGTYCVLLNDKKILHDNIVDDFKFIIDFEKIKLNKIKLNELQTIAKYYDIDILINNKKKKKNDLFNEIVSIMSSQ